MSETTDNLIFNSPKELRDYLFNKHGKPDKSKTIIEQNKGVFSIWYMTNDLWFDETVCKCRKKGMSEDAINKMYNMLKSISSNPIEKEKAKNILGQAATLMYNGELLVEIN